ncbi:hypothetical protein LSAT2_019038 [Lamellibrachia satsuma]|nr:hypothetical protein LSAT2_019038 [Lamellibrachia satsuma]
MPLDNFIIFRRIGNNRTSSHESSTKRGLPRPTYNHQPRTFGQCCKDVVTSHQRKQCRQQSCRTTLEKVVAGAKRRSLRIRAKEETAIPPVEANVPNRPAVATANAQLDSASASQDSAALPSVARAINVASRSKEGGWKEEERSEGRYVDAFQILGKHPGSVSRNGECAMPPDGCESNKRWRHTTWLTEASLVNRG